MIILDRRAVIGAALGTVVSGRPASSAQPVAELRPEFGSREAAIDTAERAASEKYRQWENGCGMARAAGKLARGRALHSRLLAYIEVHDQVFGGVPTPHHLVAVTQLISCRTEFRESYYSCAAVFDACGCPRCFPHLWREARVNEIERPDEIAVAMQRVAAADIMHRGWIFPAAGAQHAYCKFAAPVHRADGSLAPRR